MQNTILLKSLPKSLLFTTRQSVPDYDFFNVNINRSNILVKSVFAIITDSSVGAN